SPHHQLPHGGQAFRPLEDIYELQTFFNAARQRPPNRPAPRTLLGVGRDGQPAARPSSPPPRKRPSEPPQQERITPVAGLPAMKAAATALEPPAPEPAVSGSRSSFESRPSFESPPPRPSFEPPPPRPAYDTPEARPAYDTPEARPAFDASSRYAVKRPSPLPPGLERTAL